MIKRFSLHEPSLDKSVTKEVSQCIKSGWLSSTGQNVEIFEKKISEFNKSKFVVNCNSGTSALHISLKLSNVEDGDEIIVPSITFISTVNAVLYCKASPIFMDCDDSLNIDINKIILFLKNNNYKKNNYIFNKKTKKKISAILITHVFGNLTNLDKLIIKCKKLRIKLIEDAAEAFGSMNKKKIHAGTLGDFGILSFNVNKIITTGSGGALLIKNKYDFKRAKKLVNQSKVDKIFFIHDEIGYNYGMPNINAALGISQISKLKLILKKKKDIYIYYKKKLDFCKKIKFLLSDQNFNSNYWLNTISVKTKNYLEFKKKINLLISMGIEVRPLWLPCHLQSYLKKYEKFKIHKANKVYKEVICLPSSFFLKKKDLDFILKKIIHAFE